MGLGALRLAGHRIQVVDSRVECLAFALARRMDVGLTGDHAMLRLAIAVSLMLRKRNLLVPGNSIRNAHDALDERVVLVAVRLRPEGPAAIRLA